MEDTVTLEPAKTGAKPVKIIRARGLSVAIFPNRYTVRDREVTLHSISLERSYKDKDSAAFKTTHSLRRDDLLAAQQLLQQAWQWIVEEETKQKTRKS